MSDSTAVTIPEPVSVPGIRQDQYDKQEAFRQQLERNLPQIIATLPKGVRGEVMTSIAMTAALDNPALLDCSPLSMFRSVLKMASLGLRHGETCDLVPIKGRVECWVRVRGIVELAQRAGSISWAKEGYVCEGDTFEYEERETGTHFRHAPRSAPKADGSNVTHIYAIVTLPTGLRVYEVWTKERVLEHKAKNVRNIKSDSPWNTHPLTMMAKTVVKSALRFASLSPELRTAMSAGDDVGDGTFEVMTGSADPAKALAAVSGSLDAIDRLDTAIIDQPVTKMTLADAEAMILPGRDGAWGGKAGMMLGALKDSLLTQVHKWATSTDELSAKFGDLADACELILADRQDRENSQALAEAA